MERLGSPSQRAQGRVEVASSSLERVEKPSLFRRRLPLLLGAVTGLVICLVGMFVLLALNGHTPSVPAPDATANGVCDDLRTANYTALYDALAPALQQQGANAQAEFVASQRQLDIASGKVVSCAYQVQHADSAQATVTYTIARGSAPAQTGQITFNFLDGSWRIASYDTSLI